MIDKVLLVFGLAFLASAQYYPPAPGAQIAYVPIVVHNVTNYTRPNSYNPQPPYNPNYHPPGPALPSPQYNNYPPNNVVPVPAYPYPNYNAAPIYNNQPNRNGVLNNSECLPTEYTQPGARNYYFGCLHRNDSLAYSLNVNKGSRFFTGPREKTINFPGDLPKGYNTNEIITAIRCYQLKPFDGTSTVQIKRGGIGSRQVQLYLTTNDRFKDLIYRVEIYTKKM